MKQLVRVSVCVFACWANASQAGMIVLDQVNVPPPLAIFTGAPLWQQEVVAGLTGQLRGIDVYLAGPANSAFNFHLNLGNAWQTDANDFEVLFTTAYTMTVFDDFPIYIDLSTAGISLIAGDTFVFSVISQDLSIVGTQDATQAGGAYAAGRLFRNGSEFSDGSWDLGFRTYVETSTSVPEPASMALLGLTAIGVGVAQHRRRRFAAK